MNSSVIYLDSIAEIPFDSSCVVIADAALPQAVLRALPDPVQVEAGEGLKSLSAIETLADRVLMRRSTRPLTLVAVGGGSLGDAVGFLASILWRGVTLWQVPTTLLAMADSAHGGKTAVNLGSAKNQLGTFHEAESVFIVSEFLATLPISQRREGFAEILKALMLTDSRHILSLSLEQVEELVFRPHNEVANRLASLLVEAIAVKHEIVEQDQREERGIRTVLNLGHTIAHALELTAGITHGEAVAWGLRTMLDISADSGLPDGTAQHLASLLFPLLRPIQTTPLRNDLHSVIQYDKKRQGNALRSVLLRDLGHPIVTENVGADEWIRAFERIHASFNSCVVRARLRDARMVQLRPAPGKSEVNRALMIAALRPGPTRIMGRSESDDARDMVRALRRTGVPVVETRDGYDVDHARMEVPSGDTRELDCGSGGTTARFLLAMAAANIKETVLRMSPQLAQRPHEPLVHALRSGGASIESFTDARGDAYRVRGWDSMPLSFAVEASRSSQYASAIALLAAGSDTPFTLRLLGHVVSRPYLDMTLRMLKTAGVDIIENNDLLALNPTPRLSDPITLHIAPDSSALVVWKAAQYFEHMLRLPDDVDEGPDAAIDLLLDAITRGQKTDEIVLDCSRTPDLVPVLAVASLRSSRPVRINGVPHLRIKESNRIEGLVASLAAFGITIEATDDGLRVPEGASRHMHSARFDSRSDHRMLMAGFLLSMIAGEVELTDPWCVSKSYPEFWDHARMAGWTVCEAMTW